MFDKEKLSVSKTLKKVDTVDSSSYAPKQYMPSQVCPQKKRLIFYMHVTLTKKQTYFISILWLSHLFLSYFILTKFYFACIPCLPDEENRASGLLLFETYFFTSLLHWRKLNNPAQYTFLHLWFHPAIQCSAIDGKNGPRTWISGQNSSCHSPCLQSHIDRNGGHQWSNRNRCQLFLQLLKNIN